MSSSLYEGSLQRVWPGINEYLNISELICTTVIEVSPVNL